MIAALISIYNPSVSVKQNVKEVASQADVVYLCDNSDISHISMFTGTDMPENIRYTCFHENLGLSCAFNRILKSPDISWADTDFVFFFDQDSLIAEGHIQKMVSEYLDLCEQNHPVGCLGCVFINTARGEQEPQKTGEQLSESACTVSNIITSSMLTTYGNLQCVDFWNERVFLDLADWDLCWRLQEKGKLCCITDSVILHHTIGIAEKKIGPMKLRVGNPVREYYQIRECLYLLGQPYTPAKYRLRFLAMLLVRSPMHVLFLDHRKQRLFYITKGFFDFFRKKRGVIQLPLEKEKMST